MTDDPILDTTEAAAFLHLRPCTLEAWRSRGGGPQYLKFGKAIRYRLSDLQKFIAANARASTSASATATA